MSSFDAIKEVGENGNSQEPNNVWVNAMADVDDFSEHMRKIEASGITGLSDKENIVQASEEQAEKSKTQRVLEKIGVAESRNDEKKFDEDLENLSTEDALKLITFINGSFTGNKKYERRAMSYSGDVWSGAEVGGHLSPAKEVQLAAIEETLNTIKEMKDNHKRAALIYYMTNYLHLFNDGNGRTARTLYEVFDKKDFKIAGDGFMHKTNEVNEIGNRKEFMVERGLLEDSDVSTIILNLTKNDLVKEQRLPESMIRGYYSLDLPIENRPMPDVYLTDDAEQNLDNREKETVRHAFFEKPIATVALGIMLKKKGDFNFAVSEGSTGDPSNGVVNFVIERSKKDRGNDQDKAWAVLGDWDADDYRDFCNEIKDLQLRQVKKLIDVFKNEDKYKNSDGRTYADVLSGNRDK